MKKLVALAVTVVLSVSGVSYAGQWKTVGARAMGMGGAGVAIATGVDGQYYNPASLAEYDEEKSKEITLNANVSVETTQQILKVFDKLSKIANKCNDVSKAIANNDNIDAEHIKSLVESLSALERLDFSNTGVSVDANAGLGGRFGKIAISLRSYANVGAIPIIDTKNIGLGNFGSGTQGLPLTNTSTPTDAKNQQSAQEISSIIDNNGLTESLGKMLGMSAGTTADQISNALVNMASTAGSNPDQIKSLANTIAKELPDSSELIKASSSSGSYKENTSQVLFDAGAFTELSFGYGHEFIDGLKIGGNLKLIDGRMSQIGVKILENDKGFYDLISDAMKNTKSSLNVGVDLGVLIDFSKLIHIGIPFAPKFGISARNINSPTFERPDRPSNIDSKIKWNQSDYTLDRQVRAGIALNPLQKLIVGLDVDIVSNDTLSVGYDSQNFSFGAEYLLLNKPSVLLPIRAGICRNVAASKSSTEYTLGLGITVSSFKFELAGAVAPETSTVDGNDVPNSMAVSLATGFVF